MRLRIGHYRVIKDSREAIRLSDTACTAYLEAMSDERSSKRPKIEAEVVDANEALSLVLKSRGETLIFKPDMCHQLFGDDETITGHLEPSAAILIDHSSFSYAIEFESKQKSSDATKVRALLASIHIE